MTTFVSLNWRNYCGQGVRYANILFDSLQRNLAEGTRARFVVYTDNPCELGYTPGIDVRQLPHELDGWYNKLQLFKAKMFPAGEWVVFLDLDTVITGPVDELVSYSGPFAILRDAYRPDGLQSAVMCWEAGKHGYIWESFKEAGLPILAHGDQEWIERQVVQPIILQNIFPGDFVSYKKDARFGIPKGAKVVFFHGEPRPHEAGGWVDHVWKIGGGVTSQLELVPNVSPNIIARNIRYAEAIKDAIWLTPMEPHDKVALIVAGGPSLKDEIGSLVSHVHAGAHVFATNGVSNFLKDYAIRSDYQVIVDPRRENAQFVRGAGPHTICLFASTCDPKVLAEAGDRLILWHPAFNGILDMVGRDKLRTYIGGGTTCGMKAMVLAWSLGYREIHLYGFDSCYRDDAHHAYAQSLNDGERRIEVEFKDQKYSCAPWMIQQAEDFEVFAPQLMDNGVKLSVHGTGIIPAIAEECAQGRFRPEASDFRAAAILERLVGVEKPKVAEVGVFAGDLSRRLLARRSDLELTMIDSWAASPKPVYAETRDFHAALSAEDQEAYYRMTQRVTAFAGARAAIIRADSLHAAKAIPDQSLDLAFIDADHSYDGCKADIAAYYAKVKPGGFIAGHDYANDDWTFGAQVKKAVDEFVTTNGLQLDLGENFTWFARKPTGASHVV